MLSKKTRYAIIALLKLAKEKDNSPVMISEIARSENIPQRFLENILLEMKKMGLLGSRLGKKGGYYLRKDPDDIRLVEVVQHFEGSIALMCCVSERAYQPCEFCKEESECKIRGVFKDIRDYTFNVLQETSLQTLL